MQQGDCFVLASDNLNCLVHIIELGNGLCTFQASNHILEIFYIFVTVKFIRIELIIATSAGLYDHKITLCQHKTSSVQRCLFNGVYVMFLELVHFVDAQKLDTFIMFEF